MPGEPGRKGEESTERQESHIDLHCKPYGSAAQPTGLLLNLRVCCTTYGSKIGVESELWVKGCVWNLSCGSRSVWGGSSCGSRSVGADRAVGLTAALCSCASPCRLSPKACAVQHQSLPWLSSTALVHAYAAATCCHSCQLGSATRESPDSSPAAPAAPTTVTIAAAAVAATTPQEHKATLAPLVLSMLQQACAACPLHAPPSAHQPLPEGSSLAAAYSPVVAAKEAAMNAVAVGAYELHDYIPFSQWLRTSLLPVSVGVRLQEGRGLSSADQACDHA